MTSSWCPTELVGFIPTSTSHVPWSTADETSCTSSHLWPATRQVSSRCFNVVLHQSSLIFFYLTRNLFFYTGGILMPPQGFGPLHWGMQLPHQGQPFFGGTFPGARAPPPTASSGSHNQFVPLQARTFKSLLICLVSIRKGLGCTLIY